MLRIGLIGAGFMGHIHAEAYASLPHTSLVAVADTRMDKACDLAAQYGARPFPTMDQLLATVDVDLVDICLPTTLHAAHAIRALEAGKHVFCEKPIALTMTEALQVAKVARQARGKFSVGHVVRFYPEYALAHDLIAKGEVGQPRVIRTLRGSAFPRWSCHNWMGELAQSGGVTVDLACHELDWLRWCFGEAVRVHARGLAYTHLGAGEPKDHALIIVRFASGAIAHVEVTWAFPPGSPFQTSVEVAGTHGIVKFDNQSSVPIHGHWKSDAASIAVPESPLAVSPDQVQLEHFTNCILEDRVPLVSVDDAVAALELSLAALASIRTGQPVTLGGIR